MDDLDKTLRRARAAAPKIITPGPNRIHPLHPRPNWVRDGAQPQGVEYDMHTYASLMQKINDWFAMPGRVDALGQPTLDWRGQEGSEASKGTNPRGTEAPAGREAR